MSNIVRSECIIPDYANVTLTVTNNIIEVQYLEKYNNQNNIKKLNDDYYLILSTGEIRKFEKNDDRLSNKNSFRQTFKKLRYLINNNFCGLDNELFITLTYAENMQDTSRLYRDLEKFMKRLRYKYKDISQIEYITVVEPQKRGAWHAHILIKFIDLDKIYVPNALISSVWGFGFVNVQSIAKMSIDNLGAYLTAYLTDLPIGDIPINEIDKYKKFKKVNDKYFVKGARLKLYPKGMNFYRKSKGIKFPERFNIPYSDIKKYVGTAIPTYSKRLDLNTNDFCNTIIYHHYNLKRQKDNI